MDVVYMDVEDALRRLNGNKKLYIKLLGRFLEDKSYSEFEKSIESGDIQSAQHAAHTIKGLSANLSLTELYSQSAKADTMLKSDLIDPLTLQDLKDAMDKTIIAIKAFSDE